MAVPTPRLVAHRRALLAERRCPRCAERVPARLVLRGGDCPSCGGAVHPEPGVDADAAIETLAARWRRRRLVVGAAALVAAGLGNAVPLLPAVATGLGLAAVHVLLVRPGLAWLGPARRFSTRLLLRLAAAALLLVQLAASVLAAPLSIAGAPITGLLGAALVVLHAEIALRAVAGRVRREAAGPGLDAWEWALPAGLLVALGAATGVLAALAVAALRLSAALPGGGP